VVEEHTTAGLGALFKFPEFLGNTSYMAVMVYILVRVERCWYGSHSWHTCDCMTLLIQQAQFMYLWEYRTTKVAVTRDILWTVWHCLYSRHSLCTCEIMSLSMWQSQLNN